MPFGITHLSDYIVAFQHSFLVAVSSFLIANTTKRYAYLNNLPSLSCVYLKLQLTLSGALNKS